MAWLGTWAKRKKITIDNTNIDSDLLHFSVPIILGPSVGQSSQDVSDIFDDLGSNSQKIAITKSDETTQIYGEIEQWDDTGEKAVIWVAKSDLTITTASVTELYFYYDPAQADNTSYIDVAGSRTEVWVSSLKLRMGMHSFTDSTSNNNDGTDHGGITAGSATGQIGLATGFDGSNDYVGIANSSEISFDDTFSIEYCVYHDTTGSAEIAIAKRDGSTTNYQCYKGSDESIRFYDGTAERVFSTSISNQTFTYIAFTIDGSDNISLYVDGVFKETIAGSISSNSTGVFLGSFNAGQGAFLDGRLDEVRISNIALTAAWIKANHYAQTDDLITFGATETLTQTTSLSDFALDISALYESMSDHKLDVSALYESLSDQKLDIEVLGEIIKDQKTDVYACLLSVIDISLDLYLTKLLLVNTTLDISLADGIITGDMIIDISVGDGNKTQNMGLDCTVISTTPEFKSVYAMHLTSAIREI